MYKYITVCHRY